MGRGRRALLRAIGVCALLAGTCLAALSWGPLRNLFSDYQDSPAWVYLLFGAALLVPGLALVGAGLRVLLGGRAGAGRQVGQG